MAQLSTQTFSTAVTGSAITFAAASAGGDTVPSPGKRRYLYVRNDDATDTDVTIAVPGNTFNGVAAPDTVVTVVAGVERVIPITGEYTDPVTAEAAITYSKVTALSVAYLSIP